MRKYLEIHKGDYDGWGLISLGILGIYPEEEDFKEDNFIFKSGKYSPLTLKNLLHSFNIDVRHKFETSKTGLFT